MPSMSSPDRRYHKHMACLMKSYYWTVSLAAVVELGSFAVSSFVANVKMAEIVAFVAGFVEVVGFD
jgi:hypothetical protein